MLFMFLRYQAGKSGDPLVLEVLRLEMVATSLTLPIPTCVLCVFMAVIQATVVPPLSLGGLFPGPQWMAALTEGTEPYIDRLCCSYTYIPMIMFIS